MAAPAAGQIVRAADFAGCSSNKSATDIAAFNSTSFTEPSTVCGVTFVAPTSGAVEVTAGATGEINDGADDNSAAYVAFQVRTGSSIGSGVAVNTPATDYSLRVGDRLAAGDQAIGGDMSLPITGLTAGSSYNATVVFAITSGGGTLDIFGQWISTKPWFGG